MNYNLVCGNEFAKSFNKENGVIVYSGTLAIESALICSGIKNGDKVLISSAYCYAIFEAVKKVGAIPVIVIPQNNFTLTVEEVKNALDQEKKIKCIIIAHQFGIVQNIREIRKVCQDKITIIEDVAQAWDIVDSGNNAGLYSDYVITSFGKTKPLSYGVGGAVFSNNSIKEYFDFYDNESRDSKNVLIPYTYADCKKININKLKGVGDKNVKKQRNIASILIDSLMVNHKIEFHIDSEYEKSVWHRFPVVIKDRHYYKVVKLALDRAKVKYQLPHEKELYEIDMVNNSDAIIIGDKSKINDIILIRTRDNKEKNIMKFIKVIKELNYEESIIRNS